MQKQTKFNGTILHDDESDNNSEKDRSFLCKFERKNYFQSKLRVTLANQLQSHSNHNTKKCLSLKLHWIIFIEEPILSVLKRASSNDSLHCKSLQVTLNETHWNWIKLPVVVRIVVVFSSQVNSSSELAGKIQQQQQQCTIFIHSMERESGICDIAKRLQSLAEKSIETILVPLTGCCWE